jgi:hypothetical protein
MKGRNMQQVIMPFDGSVIDTIKSPTGDPLVVVRSVCDAVGIDYPNQWKKLTTDAKFNCCDMTTVAQDGKQRELVCLPLSQFNLWLAGINANKVHPDVRPRLLAYQQECADVLYKHFMPRGEQDLSKVIEAVTGLQISINAVNTKMDYMLGMDLTVFGDDAPAIKDLIEEASIQLNCSPKEVWGLIRRECDVSSYKLQNRKIMNFLRKLLRKELTLLQGGL